MNCHRSLHNLTYHAQKIIVANVAEMQEFLERNKISLAFVVETWLKPAVEETVVDIPGFFHCKEGPVIQHTWQCLSILSGI